MDKVPSNIINKNIYIKAKKKANETYKRPSAYKSAYIHKVYKELGGKYKKTSNSKSNLNRWYDEEWVQVKPYVEEKLKIKCGDDNVKNKACRPTKRINEDTPLTIDELIEKFGKQDVLDKAEIKQTDMNKRVKWEEPYDELNGGFLSASRLENIFTPTRYAKRFASSLNKIRKRKNKTTVKDEHKFLAKIASDAYKKPDERNEPGYIRNLSNDEIAVYKNGSIVDVAIRGTINKDDVKTDSLLASGFLKNSRRYKRNKKQIYKIIKKLGEIDNITGHSLGGALAQAYGDLDKLKKTNVVVFNAGVGVTGTYGKKKATFYVSEGDTVSALGMLSNKHDIRVIDSKGPSIIDKHAMDNFTRGGAITQNDEYSVIAKNTKEVLNNFIKDVKPDVDKKVLKMTKPKLVNWMRENITTEQIGDVDTFKLRYPKPIKGVNYEKKLDLKKIKKKTELDKLEEEQNKLILQSMPYSGIDPSLTFGDKAKNLNKIVLQKHQEDVLESFYGSNRRGCIIFHGVGTGKTYTAVGLCKLYLQLYPTNKVYFITPSAVVFNMIETIYGYGLDPRDPRFMYLTYDKFYTSNINTKNSLVIIDEAHNFRTEIDMNITMGEDGIANYTYGKNKRGAKLIQAVGVGYINKLTKQIGPAHKVVALTATPFVNTTYDIENLLALCDGRYPIGEETYGQIVSNFDSAYDYFKYRLSIFTNEDYLKFYPERREYFIPIVAPDDDNSIIARVTKDDNAFYIESRKASISYDGKKIEFIKDIIEKAKTKKYVIYTGFIDSGVKPIEKMLKSINITYGLITGSLSTEEKGNNITDYNNNKVTVLVITRAGAEGISLTETRGLFVLDGQWNDALYEQIVARAIRYKSHAKLPENEQYVNIYKLFVCYKHEKEVLDGLTQGKNFDFIEIKNRIDAIRQLDKIKNKDQPVRKLTKTGKVRKSSIKNEQKLENLISNSGIFDFNELDNLKKGSDERREYIEKNLQFGKNRFKYIADQLNSIMPSTDYYLFIVQKSKQQNINSFITVLNKIPDLEAIKKLYPEKFTSLDELYNELKTSKINNKTYISKFINEIKSVDIEKVNKAIKEQAKVSGDALNNLNKFIEKAAERRELEKVRKLQNLKQEFFTPDKQANELIELSKIKQQVNKSFNILEPTAGFGNIVTKLLNVMVNSAVKAGSKYKIKIHVDMVEKDEDNRKELIKLEKTAPGVLDLQNCDDFLKFVPASNYDYIFMNPPFHLKKGKEYKKDYYDIDFVKRAYAMLKPYTGILVAIVGRSWQTNENYKQFLSDVGAKITNKEEEWGETVKFGKSGTLKKLKYSYIYIRKLTNDMKLDNKLLEIPEELQTITDKIKNEAVTELIADNIDLNLSIDYIQKNREKVKDVGDITGDNYLFEDIINKNNENINLNNIKMDVIEDNIMTNKERDEIEAIENKQKLGTTEIKPKKKKPKKKKPKKKNPRRKRQ